MDVPTSRAIVAISADKPNTKELPRSAAQASARFLDHPNCPLFRAKPITERTKALPSVEDEFLKHAGEG
jgi:hypothetical protein